MKPRLASETRDLPLVSVIVAARDAAEFIEEAIRSALAQTYRNLEVVVVDDGSLDETRRIAESIAKEDDRVSVLHQPNRGVAAARNLGIERARGELIAPLDADDVWYPEKIEKQVDRMREPGEPAGLIYTWLLRIDGSGNLVEGGRSSTLQGFVQEALALSDFIACGSVPLIQRSILEKLGGYATELRERGGEGCEGWDLCLRIAAEHPFRVVPAYLVAYRRHPRQMSERHEAMRRSRHLVLDRLGRSESRVPARILRWSRGKWYANELWTALHEGRYRSALGLSSHVLRCDPPSFLALCQGLMMRRIVRRLPRSMRQALSRDALVNPFERLTARRWNCACREGTG